MLGLQHLDVPNLRGRVEGETTDKAERMDGGPADWEILNGLEPMEGKGRAEEENELETTDSHKGDDSDEPNHVDAKQMRRHRRGRTDESMGNEVVEVERRPMRA